MERKFEHLKRPCPAECPWYGVPNAPCHMCNGEEQFIRHYMHGPVAAPMTAEEREWCIEEAEHAGEGAYNREETEGLNDQDLAKATYEAWREYVQCNCI